MISGSWRKLHPPDPFDPAKVRVICFDLDGTLADTDDQYIEKAERLLRPVRFLFPKRNPAPFLRWALMAAEAPLNAALLIPDWLGIDDELVALMNWWADRRGHKAVGHYLLMAGIETLLPELARKYPLAVVTARSARATEAFLSQFNLRQHFSAIASAQTAEHTKPYPDPVHWVAQTLEVPEANCLMVGDTTVDIRAGQSAGAQTVGVLCGLGERVELERQGAQLILPHTADLAKVLLP
jgi:phosphoglycolate phosphatase-like HAD superfamily hydrolase